MATVTQLLAEGEGALGREHRRDVEVLLCHCVSRDRSYLYTWPDARVPDEQQQQFSSLVAARSGGTPIAYLLGQREFWSLPLTVTPDVLIPRPDTELLVSQALASADASAARVLDLGTGSGAVALALGSERPEWQICGVDKSPKALAVAQANGQALSIDNIEWLVSDWFDALANRRFDMIVSNPPYIDEADEHLQQGDLRFEPLAALVARDKGLADLRAIIVQSRSALVDGGCLLLEHGYQQGDAVRSMLREAGFSAVDSHCDLAGHERVSGGRWHAQ